MSQYIILATIKKKIILLWESQRLIGSSSGLKKYLFDFYFSQCKVEQASQKCENRAHFLMRIEID